MAKAFTPHALDRLEVAIGSKKLGEIFLDLGYLSRANLVRALDYQKENGGRLGWILASQGYISRLQLYEGLAKHLSLPVVTDMARVCRKTNKTLALMLTREEMARYQAIPYLIEGKYLTVLTAEPGNTDTLEFLHKKFPNKALRQVVVTDLDIMKLSEELYRENLLNTSIHGLLNRNPEESAYRVFSNEQIAFAAGFIGTLGIWLYIDPKNVILAVLFAVQFFFAVPILFKLALVIYGKIKHASIDITVPDKPYNENDLPVYTILVPAYKEKEVIGNLIKCIKRLDYPEDKLDIILLLEENDHETLQAAKAERPPANWRFLTCPNSIPRTKPKALNYGLHFARGEFLAIYDAEDMPEPDQLKKAVTAFRSHPDDYICFQAALNYFNKNENFLTKMFTLEYSGWFDCLLPGLFRSGLPIPLGGTSNHFDIKKLKKIGAWDPFNVTEDADLGIRASMEGYKVGVIDSTTYEEANSRLPNWMRQRSRWVKGYMQTFLVHSRHPFKSLKAIGLARCLSYTLLIGGTPVNFLLNPIMWVLFGLSFYLNLNHYLSIPPVLFYLAGFNLIVGNIIVIAIAMLGVIPRKNYHLIPLALLSPVYWMLQSFAAYKGFWQLLTNPFYWEKTAHGLTNSIPVSRTLEIPADIQELVVVRGNRKINYVIK